MRFLLRTIAAALLATAASAAHAEIKIGAILSVTGPASFLGDPEKKTLEKTINDVSSQVEECLSRSEKAFEFAHTAQKRFAKGDFGTKKEILMAIGSNLTLKDKILMIEATKPFFLIESSLLLAGDEKGTIEPENSLKLQTQTEQTIPTCVSWCGQGHDVRTNCLKAQELAALIYAHFKKELGIRVRPYLN